MPAAGWGLALSRVAVFSQVGPGVCEESLRRWRDWGEGVRRISREQGLVCSYAFHPTTNPHPSSALLLLPTSPRRQTAVAIDDEPAAPLLSTRDPPVVALCASWPFDTVIRRRLGETEP